MGLDVAGVCVSSMVPSLTAVDRRGVPLTQACSTATSVVVPARSGRRRALSRSRCETPRDSYVGRSHRRRTRPGIWPAQAVATNAIGGMPAIDTAMTASLGALHTLGQVGRGATWLRPGSTCRRCPTSCRWVSRPARCPAQAPT